MPKSSLDHLSAYSALAPLPGAAGCTAHHVSRLSRTLVRLYDHHMQGSGVTIGQFGLLRGLRRAPLTTGELAQLIGTDRTTLTRTLQPLLDQGLVIKTAGVDARVRMLELSALGLERYRVARAAWRRAQGLVEEVIGTLAIRELHSITAAIGERLDVSLREA